MKKFFILLGITAGLFQTTAMADGLKNSLNTMLNEKEDTSSVVNLGAINLSDKPRPTQPNIKTRPATAVVATVNGHNIVKKEADAYIKKRTNGKVADFDFLPPEQKARLIQEIALPLLVKDASQKELSQKEKKVVYTQAWMRAEAQKMKITDEKVKAEYNALMFQARAKDANASIPPFEPIKERLKVQMIEKALVDKVTKDADIKVAEGNNTQSKNAGTVNGEAISIEEANQALSRATKGKMTWETLPDEGKKQLINMIAPGKLMEAQAQKSLSAKEKEVALTNVWMQKKMSSVNISDTAAQGTYDKMVKAAKASKSKQKIPTFEASKERIKMQMAQEKVITTLVKNAKISVK